MKKLKVKFSFLLLFSFCSIFAFAQESGGDGGGETRIWEPDLVELWIWWHKKQYAMFSDFAKNEDALQRKQYEDYMDYMKKLAEMDAILFSQYTNNSVPKIPFFLPDVAYGGILITDIMEAFVDITSLLAEPPVDAQLVNMFANSSLEMLSKFTYLIVSTEKVLRGGDNNLGVNFGDVLNEFDDGNATFGLHKDNLRDNRFRDDLMNNIIKELGNIKRSLHSLFERMRTGKQELLFNELLNQ
ncbi:MAG: hypothetical protein LBI82_05650 [Dysgonamonadaceae bacterium]|jgi:hypothetical protein|nr:hypothetical protein [Dysgonamonadaceae bacterium]